MANIFISSTYEDLVDYRAKVYTVIDYLSHTAVRMESFLSRPENATEVCEDEIERSDIIIGIYAHSYGSSKNGDEASFTEQEFDYAISMKKPVLCFLIDEDYPWKPKFIDDEPKKSKLAAFKNRLGNVHVRFTSPDDLAIKVSVSITQELKRQLLKKTLDAAAEKHPIPQENKNQVMRRAEHLADINGNNILKNTRILLLTDDYELMTELLAVYRQLEISFDRVSDPGIALLQIENHHHREDPYHLVISDMKLGTDSEAGKNFVKQMSGKPYYIPTIFYVLNFLPNLGTPAYAFGISNKVDELLNLTFDIIERVRI